MRRVFLSGCAAFGLLACSAAEKVAPEGPTVAISDFEVVEGDEWVGNLTYLDYTSQKRVSIPTAASVEITGQSTVKYTVSYPEEPWEDAKANIKLSKSGRVFNGHPVITREDLDDGRMTFAIQYAGEDDNQKADIRITYTLAPSRFVISKDVRPTGAEDFTNRNVYLYTR